jgi:ribosome-binding factor A
MRPKNINTYRHLRVARLIRIALEEIFLFGKGLDAKLQNSESCITNVVISSDLKLVTCYFIPSVTAKITAEELLKALNDSKFFVRKTITTKVALKYSPEVRFIYDHGFINAINVNRVLNLE